MVTAVTNKILPQIEKWQQRPLSAVYPIVFIDAIHFSVRDERMQAVTKKWHDRYPNAMKRWEENWEKSSNRTASSSLETFFTKHFNF